MSTPQGGIVGNYRLIERIGRGGMGVVYRGQHLRLGSEAAVKVLAASLAEEADFVQRFRREAVSAAALDHPNIVRVWDYGEQDGLAYLVMPLLAGGSLETRLRHGPLPLDQALTYLRAIADALDYAHSKGIVHRDLKPANILLDERGEAHLADFGIAQVVGSTERLTRTGVGIGTPEYMAPEQLQGRAERRSDFYALGVVLYQMLSGQVPYGGSTPYEVITKHLTAVLPPVRQFNPAVPAAVEGVLACVLAKSPEDRYESGAALTVAFARSIQEASSGPGIAPRTDDQPTMAAVHTPPESPRTVPMFTPPGGATVAQFPLASTPLPAQPLPPRSRQVGGQARQALTARPVVALSVVATVVIVCLAATVLLALTRQASATAQATTIMRTPTVAQFVALATAVPTTLAGVTPTIGPVPTATPTAPPTSDTTATVQAGTTATARAASVASALATATAQAQATGRAQATSTAQVAAVAATNTASAGATAQVRASATATAEAARAAADTQAARSVIIHGPANGQIDHDPDRSGAEGPLANVNVSEMILEAKFFNPYQALQGPWDYGFVFRYTPNSSQYDLVVRSDQYYYLYYYNLATQRNERISTGWIANLDLSAGGANTLTVFISEGRGLLFVNGAYIAALDLGAHTASGNVAIITGYLRGDEIAGRSTYFEGFTIQAPRR